MRKKVEDIESLDIKLAKANQSNDKFTKENE
jgi:hypothetical protein